MKIMLLAAAALAASVLPTPTGAQAFTGGTFAGRSNQPRFVAPSMPGDCREIRGSGHHHGHGDRGFACGGFTGGWAYADSEWAVTNNHSWDSDSYNDWWHDRPDRAFPRWMQSNQDCARLWWGGGGWRC